MNIMTLRNNMEWNQNQVWNFFSTSFNKNLNKQNNIHHNRQPTETNTILGLSPSSQNNLYTVRVEMQA